MKNRLKRGAALIMPAALMCMASCIDNNYRIDEIDKEVHLAPGGVSFPLGYIEQKTLGEIINKDIIATGTDGYVLRHSGKIGYTIDAFNVNSFSLSGLDGLFGNVKVSASGGNSLPESIAFEGESRGVDLGIPSFDMSGGTSIQKLDLRREGDLPGGLGVSVGADQTFSGTVVSGTEASIEIDVTLPEQVARVNKVWFKDEAGGTNPNADAATVRVTLDLGGLAPVTQSVSIDKFTVTLPTRYSIKDAEYDQPNCFIAENIDLGAGPYVLEFYITAADLSDLSPDGDNNINKKEDFSYTIEYTITTKAGQVGSAKPATVIEGAPAFRDAEFTTNQINFAADESYAMTREIEVGDAVESVSYVAFEGANTFNITMDDPGMPDLFQNELPVIITFPPSFDMAKVSAGGIFSDNTLTVKANELVGGCVMRLDGIRFDGAAGTPADGKLTVGGDVKIEVNHAFEAGKTLLWSNDVDNKTITDPLTITIGGMILALDYDNCEYTLNSVSQEVGAKGEFEDSFDLPAAIKEITQAAIATAAGGSGAEVEMVLSVETENWFEDLEEFYLDDFTIQLPSFLIIDGSGMDGSFDERTNTYSVERITISGQTTELARFKVMGLGGISVDDAKATVKGDFEFSAIARTPDGITIDPEDEDMTITPRLEISDIRVTGLEGMFDIDFDDYIDSDNIKPIDFSEVFDFLSDDEQRPDLAPPVLTIDIKNPLGVNFLGNIELSPKNADGEPTDNPIRLDNFRVDPACDTRIYITDDGDSKAPASYTGYNSPLSQLVSVIPHTVDIALGGKVNPDKNLLNSLLIGEDYEFELDYTIEIPLAFGPDMSMTLEFDVDKLNDTFSKLAEQKVKAADITVYAGLTVTFPLKVKDVQIEFTDSQGAPVPDLVTEVNGSIEGPAAGNTPRKSTLAIRLAVPDGGDFTTLSEIDILKIRIPISSADDASEEAQNRLTPGDWIEGNIWIELAKGVSVNLGDLD